MIARSETNRTSLALALAAGLAALFGIALVKLPLPTVGIILAAILVVVLAIFNQVLALYAVALAAALSPEISIGIGVNVRVDDLLMSVFAGVWLLRKMTFGDRRGTVLDRILVAYLLVGLASILWGTYLGTAHYTLDKLSSAPFHFLKRAEFVFLFFVIVDTLRTTDQVKNFTYVLMAALVGLSGYSLVEYFITRRLALAPTGAPIHEPGWASLLNIALCLSLLPAASRPGKVLLSAIVCFSLAVLPLTFGRNFMASTFFIILYVGLVQQRWVLLFLPAPILTWLVTYPKLFVNRILTFKYLFALDLTGTHTRGAAVISRVIAPLHYAALALGFSPLLGFGLGSVPLGSIDSEYATQIAYTGFIGLAIFLMLGALLFRVVRETRKAATTPLVAALANSYLLILLAYAFFSTLSASISAQRAGTFFFIAVGMMAALHRSVTESATASEGQRVVERHRPSLVPLGS